MQSSVSWLLLLSIYVCGGIRVTACSCGLFVFVAGMVFHCVSMLSFIHLVLMGFLAVSSIFFFITKSATINVLLKNVFLCWVGIESYI